MVLASPIDWLVFGLVALLVCMAETFRRRRWLGKALRPLWPRSDSSLGVVNSVIGVVLALAAVPAPWSLVIAFAVAAIGARQFMVSERDYKRRDLERKAAFYRRARLLDDRFELLTQNIVFHETKNRMDRNSVNPSDAAALQRLHDKTVKIERKKAKAVRQFNLRAANEALSLVEEMEEQYGIDCGVIYSHINAAGHRFDDLLTLRQALRDHVAKLPDV